MMWLRQSTAVTRKIGPFLDATDGGTPETVLTISQADVLLSKEGGALTQKNDATACTHDANGWYGCPLNATDTATLGSLQLSVTEAGACPVWHEYSVLPANVYDSLFSTDYLKVDVADWLNATAPANTGDAFALIGAAGAGLTALGDARLAELAAANLPADIDTIKVDVAGPDGAAMRGTDNADLASVCTEARLAELGAANLPADIDVIKIDVAGLDGTAMRGTDNAALAAVCTELRLARLDENISAAKTLVAGAITATTIATGAVDADAVATDAINEIRDAIFAKASITAVGTVTFAQILARLYAAARGKIAKAGDAYTFYDDDGTTALFTLTIAAASRTPS